MKSLVNLFKALSDDSRIRILNLLLYAKELCVCDIQKILNFSQSKVSRHLTYLKNAGLVDDRRFGMWVIYTLTKSPDRLHENLLKELKDVLNLENSLAKDIENLKKSLQEGTCTTYRKILKRKLEI